jgi:hypothetical protein
MARQSLDKIELRTAKDLDGGMSYFLGYNPMPAKRLIARSIANDQQYAQIEARHNRDGSATLQFFRNNFTDFTDLRARSEQSVKAVRQDRFLEFVADRVLPQLMEASGCEVVWNGQLASVELPTGELSLFTPALESAFAVQQQSIVRM